MDDYPLFRRECELDGLYRTAAIAVPFEALALAADYGTGHFRLFAKGQEESQSTRGFKPESPPLQHVF